MFACKRNENRSYNFRSLAQRQAIASGDALSRQYTVVNSSNSTSLLASFRAFSCTWAGMNRHMARLALLIESFCIGGGGAHRGEHRKGGGHSKDNRLPYQFSQLPGPSEVGGGGWRSVESMNLDVVPPRQLEFGAIVDYRSM